MKTFAQVKIEYETIGKSELSDYWGNTYGKGNLNKTSISYSAAISKKWGLNTYVDYITMSNTGEANDINDHRIVNLGLGGNYCQPLSAKWDLLLTAGVGIFAPAHNISLKSILGNGGGIFICHINPNIDIGGGIGISNAYGVPILMPMIYLNWHRGGKFNFNIDMANGINVGASTKLGSRITINLTAINISGISAVRELDGQTRIYSQLCVYSSLSPSFTINKYTSLYFGIGGSWARSVTETDRTLKAFFNGFSEEHKSKDFGVALRLNAGIKLTF